MRAKEVDVVGLGLNATDTVLLVRKFPPLGGKQKVEAISRQAGGQITTALVTCRRLGLSARYVGKVGDNEDGRILLASLRAEGVEVQFTMTVPDTPNQLGMIIVDQASGERTVFWDRSPRLAVSPAELAPEAFETARILLIDGCDVPASLAAAKWARKKAIPVVADFDTAYENVEKLFPLTDYLIASHDFLPAVTDESDHFRALQFLAREYDVQVAGVTLGLDGALVFARGRFHYSPGFVVQAVDTTGAGDVFHGALIYGILEQWPLARSLDFANAMAALNCTALGARGGIATRPEAEKLIATGTRRNPAYKAASSRTKRNVAGQKRKAR